jgi:hypothetical protein
MSLVSLVDRRNKKTDAIKNLNLTLLVSLLLTLPLQLL